MHFAQRSRVTDRQTDVGNIDRSSPYLMHSMQHRRPKHQMGSYLMRYFIMMCLHFHVSYSAFDASYYTLLSIHVIILKKRPKAFGEGYTE